MVQVDARNGRNRTIRLRGGSRHGNLRALAALTFKNCSNTKTGSCGWRALRRQLVGQMQRHCTHQLRLQRRASGIHKCSGSCCEPARAAFRPMCCGNTSASGSAHQATCTSGGQALAATIAPTPCSRQRARPNPSLKGSTNGGPRGPGWRYAVHFRHPGPRVPPLAPP